MIRPSLLYVSHKLRNRGGVENHVRDLRAGLQQHFAIWVLFRDGADAVLMAPDGSMTRRAVEAPSWPLALAEAPLTAQFVGEALKVAKPHLIHIHHLHQWHHGLLDQIQNLGRPTVFSFHDYHTITPHWGMQGVDSPLECFTPKYSIAAFGADLSVQLRERARELNQHFAWMRAFIAPSPTTARCIAAIHPLQIQVIEHGIPALPSPPKVPAPNILRFAYLGSLIPQKGWELALVAFRNIREEFPQARLSFYGGKPLPDEQHVSFKGAYDPLNLPLLLSEVDVGIIPSLFPETYCLTLSELFRSGIPTIASNLGALSNRVVDGSNGRKFIPGNVASLSGTLRWFLENPAWRHWTIPPPRFTRAMLADYFNLYSQLLAAHH